ncbi:hypothetical protein ACH42_16495 [Endozoicomonas sp. (ex Bugula neritina AB1)]|nr:hypothetical protein ACH42_16495 [Endozoicomonas sp. (ex Bugula neritina AB1)]
MTSSSVSDLTSKGDPKDEEYRDASTLLKNFSSFENNLINLSANLIAILTTLSQQKNPQNLPELHQYLLRNMSELHNRGLHAGYPPRLMEKVCYVLCAAFDEEIMNTSWGQEACWENHSLVAQLFQQRNAGEVFFTLLEQARQNTTKMLDFIELLYLLLRLGFCGQYQNTDKHGLAELVDSLYQDISQHRAKTEPPPLPVLNRPWQPLKEPKLWHSLPLIALLLILMGIATHFWIVHINSLYDDDLQWLQHPPAKISTANGSPTL